MHKPILTLITIFILIGIPLNISAEQPQNDEENNFGLYGFNLNLSLEDAFNLAEKNNYSVALVEHNVHTTEIPFIKYLIKLKNIQGFTRPRDAEQKNILTDAQLWIGSSLAKLNKNNDIFNIFQIIFNINEGCSVLLSFLIEENKKNYNLNDLYPFSVTFIMYDKNYYEAAKELLEERADSLKEIAGKTMFIKNSQWCQIVKGRSIFILFIPSILKRLNDKINNYINEQNEKLKKEQETQLQQLQKGM